jgi:hypothetical protein
MPSRHMLLGALRLGAIPVILTVALTACSSAGEQAVDPETTPSAAGTQAPGTSAAVASPSPSAETTPITLELDDEQIVGELDGSATSASLISQLPLTLSFRDYGGQEKVAELPAPLDLEGAPAGSNAAALTIGYYVPDQRLVLYYDDVSYFSGIVPIGTYQDADPIRDRPDSFTVTVRRAA